MSEVKVDEDEIAMGFVEDLISVMKDTMAENEKDKKVKRKNAILVFIENYERIVSIPEKGGKKERPSSFADHLKYFYDIYDTGRDDILDTFESRSWIKNNIIVWFGNDVEKVRRSNIKLPISAVYKKALKMQKIIDKAEELRQLKESIKIKGSEKNEDEEDEELENPAQFYPDEIMYYLLCIFLSCIRIKNLEEDKEDIPILEDIILSIGKDIGIIPENVGKRQQNSSGVGDSLGGLFGGIKEIMRRADVKGPDGKCIADTMPENLDGDGIASAITGFFSNDKVTKQIGESMNKMSETVRNTDPNNISESLGTVFKEVGPSIVEGISTMINDMPPPPGVTDKRTDLEREQEKKRMQESLGGIVNAGSQLASSEHVQNLAKGLSGLNMKPVGEKEEEKEQEGDTP